MARFLRSAPFCAVVYVNDGSRDGALEILRSLSAEHDNVAVVDLSGNFGKETALTAGLDHACGDAVVVIDADLQDPPEVTPDFVRGSKVYGQRERRAGETLMKRLTAHLFYRIMSQISGIEMPIDTRDLRVSDLRLMNQSARRCSCAPTSRTSSFHKGAVCLDRLPSARVPL